MLIMTIRYLYIYIYIYFDIFIIFTENYNFEDESIISLSFFSRVHRRLDIIERKEIIIIYIFYSD